MTKINIGAFILVLLGALFVVVRVTSLERFPPGFYVDEAGEAGNVLCLAATGQSYLGEKMPLYTTGPAEGKLSPVIIYSQVLWTKIFGSAVGTFRLYVALWNLVGLVGLFLLGRLFGGKLAGLLAVLTALMSPWALLSSRVAWDPALAVTPLVFGVYLLARARQHKEFVAAAILLSFTTYTYQAMRVDVPLMSVLLLGYACWDRRLSWQKFFSFSVAALLVAIPQILFVLSPAATSRFQGVTILTSYHFENVAGGSYWKFLLLFLDNFFAHLAPRFLFVSGDANLRHSLLGFGQLGYLEVLALAIGLPLMACKYLWKRWQNSRLELPPKMLAGLVIAAGGIASGIVPAALTWDGIPHALRSVGAWPFFALFTGLTLAFLIAESPRVFRPAVLIISFCFAGKLLHAIYFGSVNEVSTIWFDDALVNQARKMTRQDDWKSFITSHATYSPDALAYHLMHSGQFQCPEAQTLIGEVLAAKALDDAAKAALQEQVEKE